MRIRPYIEHKDYEYIEKWIDDERAHALWCANLIPYPVTKENLHKFLKKSAVDWTDSAYVATEDNGKIIGFFCYSINVDDNTGFFKFVIVDPKKRGTGYGKKMLQLALQYAFNITNVNLVQLNVFEENITAKHCYKKIGFTEDNIAANVFQYKGELWSRCHMIIRNL
ncbi:MAG: GNAT family N-acetyltransferase [Bacteroidales bacterium]|nr:GNAT family N-acetyltransferase [Lachnoclostridium sp.]MCM1383706.1 GNAT family N-acetyltransferase [Lachnoclostridium sp.]MCM1464334.1 GNAT family N-acetyltransferase [Bacteroidales bacterium]